MPKFHFSIFLFCFFCSTLLAQKDLPIIYATNVESVLIEGDDIRTDWYLTPEAKPDVYKMSKNKATEWVALYTDIDSIKVQLKPGETFDFIVILNEKDSCHNRFIAPAPITKYQQQIPATHDTIPFVLTDGNNITLQVLLNYQDTLDLMFDCGGTVPHITYDALTEKTDLLREIPDIMMGKRNPNWRDLGTKNTMQIGNLHWKNLVIYPTRVSGHFTDGRIGWDFFDGRILEIDYENNWFIVHSSLTEIPTDYSDFEMLFRQEAFYLAGNITVEGKTYGNKFLLDSGFNRALLLDSLLNKQQNFPTDLPVLKTTSLKDGRGKKYVTKIVNIEQVNFGNLTIKNVPTQLLNTPNPAGFPVHFAGNELMKRFNTIYDFQENKIYLKPNNLWNVPYKDRP